MKVLPYPPSKYIFSTYAKDVEDVRECFYLYDYRYVAEHKEIQEKMHLFHNEMYLRTLLQKLLRIYDETFDNLRDLENQIALAEEKLGIKIIYFVGEEE